MSAIYSGGCACGAVRYTVSGHPIAENHCQCRQCQRDSGTGHSSHVIFRGAQHQITGEPRFWVATGDSGLRKSRAFCPTCGVSVFMTLPDMPEFFIPRAGSLDEPARFEPQFITWTEASQPWDTPGVDLPRFERMPPS